MDVLALAISSTGGGMLAQLASASAAKPTPKMGAARLREPDLQIFLRVADSLRWLSKIV
jgi:hypothetical protein